MNSYDAKAAPWRSRVLLAGSGMPVALAFNESGQPATRPETMKKFKVLSRHT
jgi:hypothetical protein